MALSINEFNRLLEMIQQIEHENEDLPLPDDNGVSDHEISKKYEIIYDERCCRCRLEAQAKKVVNEE